MRAFGFSRLAGICVTGKLAGETTLATGLCATGNVLFEELMTTEGDIDTEDCDR